MSAVLPTLITPPHLPTPNSDLVDSLASLALNVGDCAADDPAAADTIDSWCEQYGARFERLLETALLTSSNQGQFSADRIRASAQNELDAALHAAAEGPGGNPTPNRVSTALCCHALNKIAKHRQLRHFHHISALRKELFRSIYRSTQGTGTSSPTSSPISSPLTSPVSSPKNSRGQQEERDQATLNSLSDLLHATPYFEVVRKLKRRVDALIHERNLFERARSQ